MGRVRSALIIATFCVLAIPLHGQAKATTCPMKFSIAIKDVLGNVDSLTPSDQKWLDKFLRHYQGMCYVSPSSDVKILLSISISAQEEQVIPRVVSDPVYTLQILDARNGFPKVIRTFQRAKTGTSRGGVPGILASMGNPQREVIQDAVDWIAKANIDLGADPASSAPEIATPKS